MITEISIPPQTVPFDKGDKEIVRIANLRRVNFFFGPNGSGKTTISRLIDNEASNSNSEVLTWSHNTPVKTYVYNKNFVERNFKLDSKVPGVFTMGEDSVEARKQAESLAEEINKEREKLARLENNLEDAQRSLKSISERAKNSCWQIKKELPEIFKPALKGAGTKEGFYKKTRNYLSVTESAHRPDLEEMKKLASIVFDDSASYVNPMDPLEFEGLSEIENNSLFVKKIFGKEDVPISSLIKRLRNSDWVASGLQYINDDNICPFCQQPTLTDALKEQLESFFDETYHNDLSTLKNLEDQYQVAAEKVVGSCEMLLKQHEEFFDTQAMQIAISELKRITQKNSDNMRRKISNPSMPVDLDSSIEVCTDIRKLYQTAEGRIDAHNEVLANRQDQKESLINDIWQYIASRAEPLIKDDLNSEDNSKKEIEGLRKSEETTSNRIQAKESKESAIEQSMTNVKDSARHINELLKKFGFNSFEVHVAEDEKSYLIERENGDPAEDTLSEGETHFLTFLYFFSLMRGSQETSGVLSKRIIVIDDPITSMDSSILFVVSALIRRLAFEARKKDGNIDQLIVLTHNITFHHEVTYVRAGKGDKDTAYYVLQKCSDHTEIVPHETNPISSTYELLWKDLYDKDCKPLTAQNVSRRIVETFFKFVGTPNIDSILLSMESPDQEIARSFWAWANAGSHLALEDETFFNTSVTTENFRQVLKLIFEQAGYGDHFSYMVKLVSSDSK